MSDPVRSCLACRTRRPKTALVRLAARGTRVMVDRHARVPGRGAYLCPDSRCLDQALRHRGRSVTTALRVAPMTVDAEALRADFASGASTGHAHAEVSE